MHIQSIRIWVMVLAGLLVGSLAVSLARADNSLNCTFQDESGKPTQKLDIVLINNATGKQWKKKTNDKGMVEIKGLPDGAYHFEGRPSGYLLTKAEDISLAGNQAMTCNPVFVSIDQLNQLLSDAMEAAKTEKPDIAIEKAQAAVALAPRVPQAHNMLAVAYARKGMVQEAMASAKKAVEIDKQFEQMLLPIQMEALGAQASQALTSKNFDGAIQKYQEIAALAPEEPSVYYNMALAYGHKGEFEKAIETIDKAIQLSPDDLEFKQRKLQLQDLYLKSTEKGLELK